MSETQIAASPTTESSAAASAPVAPSMDSIAQKMTAMKSQTLRNQMRTTEQTTTGESENGSTGNQSNDSEDNLYNVNTNIDAQLNEAATEEDNTQSQDESVSADTDVDNENNNTNNVNADEIIDFVDFATTNPNAKFKFMRNGKEIIIDAKKAAALLGQGSVIHEDARQLKVDRAEFDDYVNDHRSRQEGLTLAMEFTVQPKLQKAYDEILKTQKYQNTFNQQLQRAKDPTDISRIRASMQQNENYIKQQSAIIQKIKPNVEQFRAHRQQEVTQRLSASRKAFTDKDLKNEFVFNEIREKVSKVWPGSKQEMIPGVPNIDLLSSDEGLLSLIRDGLRYRDKPSTKSAGSSLAALTNRKSGSTHSQKSNDNITQLRDQAKAGGSEGRKASDNLLMAQLTKLRAGRR